MDVYADIGLEQMRVNFPVIKICDTVLQFFFDRISQIIVTIRCRQLFININGDGNGFVFYQGAIVEKLFQFILYASF